MKKILLFLLLSVMSFSTFAQNDDKQAIKEKIAEQTCECIENSDIDLEDKAAIEAQFGACILQAIGANEDAVVKLDLDFSSEETMHSFGREIGLLVAGKCPSIFIGLAKQKLEDKNKKESTISTISGAIEKVEEGEFVVIIVKDDNGRSHKLYWLDFFENADQLKDNYKSLKGKKLEVSYKEQEYYHPKLQDYSTIKVMTKIELK
ncbi:hypothetical protein WAF17_20405 [Bernardetia sp. ABR2-2B]|uniref:hypothetical protein n=1 Tax=Bernardetia sp. ABR2-2B TaxID=3127472 RepID=UPI0030CD7F44